MIKDYQVLLRPLVTEKNTALMENNKYCFQVATDATKPQIKRAVENIFNVSVVKVHTMNVRGKRKRRGRDEFGYTAAWKKAIVTLVEGDHIGLFES
jgi:large subunit ribosomal protein L23